MSKPIPISARLRWDCLFVVVLIGVLAWLSLAFARGPGELAAVWVGNGILTGWLLSRPTALWPAYVVGAMLADAVARLLLGFLPLHALALGVANIAEVLIVAVSVRRRVPNIGDPKRWNLLGRIATTSTLVACAASGLLAATTVVLFKRADFASSFITWYAAHVVGMVIFATSTLVLHREGRNLFAPPGHRRSFAMSMLLVAGVGVAVFLAPYPVLFMAYPPLLMGAFRFRFPGVAVGIVLLGTIGSVATAMGKGPLWLVDDVGAAGRIALLQLYIACGCLMTIPIALSMAERKRLNARLRDSEQRYRMLADYSHDVIVRMRIDGERLYVSPSARDILGWSPMEMLGSRWGLVHPDDRALQQQTMQDVIATGRPHTAVYRIEHRDGHYVWIEAVTRPIPSADGDGMDIIYTGRDISRRVAAEQALEASRRELERLARVDALTGLPNRRQFDERLQLALVRLQRHATPVALMYLDVDHFKRINDTWGHAVGDRVLCSFAERLSRCVRTSDLVARLGGDEFVVVIEDAAMPQAAEAIARKLLIEMHHAIDIGQATLMATTSIGIAYAGATTDASTLLTTADAALYAAKQAGRNTYRIKPVFDPARGNERADS